MQSIETLQQYDRVAGVVQVLVHHEALGMVNKWAQLVECTPEILSCPPAHLRCLFNECRDRLHLRDHDIQVLSVSLRNDRAAAHSFFTLDPETLGPRYDNIVSILNLSDGPNRRDGAKLVCFHPKLLLVEERVLSSAAEWLCSVLGWHRDVLRHSLLTLADYDILTRETSDFNAIVDYLMLEMNMSVHEVSCLVRCAPKVLSSSLDTLAALASDHPSSFQLAAALLKQEKHPTDGWVTNLGVLKATPRVGQLNMLYLLSKGVNPQEIERLAVDRPTMLRRPLWTDE